MKSLSKLCINYIVDEPKIHHSEYRRLPADLRKMIYLKKFKKDEFGDHLFDEYKNYIYDTIGLFPICEQITLNKFTYFNDDFIINIKTITDQSLLKRYEYLHSTCFTKYFNLYYKHGAIAIIKTSYFTNTNCRILDVKFKFPPHTLRQIDALIINKVVRLFDISYYGEYSWLW